ncbi:MAG: type II secretion system minor pseudopilin GspK [bacterium]
MPGHQQTGVALLSALIVVALAATAATALMSSQQFGMRRAENIISRDQAYQYLLGAEQWASTILVNDAKDTDIDTLEEDWAQDLPPLPVEGGTIAGKLSDLTALFNLNSVVDQEGKPSPVHYDRMQRLLEALKLEKTLLDPLVDWIDSDSDYYSPSGAEDDFYFGLAKPYRTGSAPLASVTELLLLRGIDEKIYKQLRPFVTPLPEPAALNINTAPKEVLISLGIDAGAADESIQKRPFDKVDDFLAIESVKKANIETSNLGVTSTYFLLESHARIGRARLKQFSILKRDGKAVRVVSRSLGTL